MNPNQLGSKITQFSGRFLIILIECFVKTEYNIQFTKNLLVILNLQFTLSTGVSLINWLIQLIHVKYNRIVN